MFLSVLISVWLQDGAMLAGPNHVGAATAAFARDSVDVPPLEARLTPMTSLRSTLAVWTGEYAKGTPF